MIRNPIEEIKKAIPQLAEIPNNPNNLEYVSYSNFDSRLKRIETANLKKYRKSITWCSLGSYFNPCILEAETDNKIIVINKKKYKLITDYLKSDAFNTEQPLAAH